MFNKVTKTFQYGRTALRWKLARSLDKPQVL